MITTSSKTEDSREEEREINPVPHEMETATSPPQQKQNFNLRHVVVQTLSLLWLGPVITLLVLNAEAFVIGPSFKCPTGVCTFNPFVTNITQVIQHLNVVDRDVLGSLQLVAKALELWFLFAVGILVYNISMLLARRGRGLPLRYLFTHTEYSNPQSLGKSFWTSAFPQKDGVKNDNNQRSKTSTATTFLFVASIVVLCIISNLMGPATAVLLLPTQKRTNITSWDPGVFVGHNAGIAPIGDNPSLFYDSSCHTCNYQLFQYLDAAAVAAIYNQPVTLQLGNSASITVNATFSQALWTPNGQTLANLTHDVWVYEDAFSYNFSTTNSTVDSYHADTLTQSIYNAYKSSLQAVFQRQGPVMASFDSCMLGNVSTISISQDRSIRCYSSYTYNAYLETTYNFPLSDPDRNISTRCFRVGSGWTNAKNDYSQFYITNGATEHNNSSPTNPDFTSASINVYSVASVVFLNSTTNHCSTIANDQADSSCNWEAMFSEDLPSQYRNISLSQQVVEYIYPNTTVPYYYTNDTYLPIAFPGVYSTSWCSSITYLSFATYSIDMSTGFQSGVNQATMPSIENIPPSADPIYVHPDWTLLAWAVNDSGTVDSEVRGGEIIGDLLGALTRAEGLYTLTVIQSAITISSLSLINYDTSSGIPPVNTSANHIFHAYVSAEVWSYGLSSITSKLGFAVAILGCLIVFFGFIVGLLGYNAKQDVLEIFVSGLRQSPPEELSTLPYEQVIRSRFVMEDHETKKLTFSNL